MRSLVQIVSEANRIEQILVESDGEVSTELESFLSINAQELSQKVDNYSILLDRLDMLEGFYKEQADFYSQIAKRCKNVQERLKDNIKLAIKSLDTDEVAGESVRFKLTRTKPMVVIIDESLIPKDYFTVVSISQLNKDRLKDDLEVGEIAGVKLEPSFSLRTYANNKNLGDKS